MIPLLTARTVNASYTADTGKLRERSEGFRVASEALIIAADHGCSDELYAALFELVRREAAKVEG